MHQKTDKNHVHREDTVASRLETAGHRGLEDRSRRDTPGRTEPCKQTRRARRAEPRFRRGDRRSALRVQRTGRQARVRRKPPELSAQDTDGACVGIPRR